MLLEKSCPEYSGLCGEYARAMRGHLSVKDDQKIAAPHGVPDILEHLTLRHTLQLRVRSTRAEGCRI